MFVCEGADLCMSWHMRHEENSKDNHRYQCLSASLHETETYHLFPGMQPIWHKHSLAFSVSSPILHGVTRITICTTSDIRVYLGSGIQNQVINVVVYILCISTTSPPNTIKFHACEKENLSSSSLL